VEIHFHTFKKFTDILILILVSSLEAHQSLFLNKDTANSIKVVS
jgi:hypothetical protein